MMERDGSRLRQVRPVFFIILMLLLVAICNWFFAYIKKMAFCDSYLLIFDVYQLILLNFNSIFVVTKILITH